MSLNVTQSNNNLTLQVSQSNVKATLSVTQNIKELHITAIQNNEIIKLQPVINVNSSEVIETDPVFVASEAYLFEEGDKEKLDNLFNTTNHSQLTLNDGTNPHGTTKSDVGLGNVDNTSDLDKPISTATQNALDSKLDKVETVTTEKQFYVKNADGTQAMVNESGVGDYFTLGSPVITVADIANFTRLTNFTTIVAFSQDTGTSDHSLLSTKFINHNIFGRVPYDCVLESLTINNQFGISSGFEISIWVADAITADNKVEVAHISYVPSDVNNLFTIPASIVIPKGSQIQVFIKRPSGGGVSYNRGFWLFFKKV